MKISIIITTKNEEFNLTRLLNSMLKIKNKVIWLEKEDQVAVQVDIA